MAAIEQYMKDGVEPTDTEISLSIAHDSLCRQIDREIIGLRDYLKDIQDKDLENAEKCAEVAARIVYASIGLKKLTGTMEYIDCWMDNGDPPQISTQTARYEDHARKT